MSYKIFFTLRAALLLSLISCTLFDPAQSFCMNEPAAQEETALQRCPICWEDLQQNQANSFQLSCHQAHRLHRSCLEIWLKNSVQQNQALVCPWCRQDLSQQDREQLNLDELGLRYKNVIRRTLSSIASNEQIETFIGQLPDFYQLARRPFWRIIDEFVQTTIAYNQIFNPNQATFEQVTIHYELLGKIIGLSVEWIFPKVKRRLQLVPDLIANEFALPIEQVKDLSKLFEPLTVKDVEALIMTFFEAPINHQNWLQTREVISNIADNIRDLRQNADNEQVLYQNICILLDLNPEVKSAIAEIRNHYESILLMKKIKRIMPSLFLLIASPIIALVGEQINEQFGPTVATYCGILSMICFFALNFSLE